MKTILRSIVIASVVLTGLCGTAAARHPRYGVVISTYRSGHAGCGCAIYTERFVLGSNGCGNPVYGYRQVPIIHRCRPAYGYCPPPAWHGHRDRDRGRDCSDFRSVRGAWLPVPPLPLPFGLGSRSGGRGGW